MEHLVKAPSAPQPHRNSTSPKPAGSGHRANTSPAFSHLLSTLADASHKMLDVPVDAFSVEQRRQFMSLQAAGQHLQALLQQAAARLEDAFSAPPV